MIQATRVIALNGSLFFFNQNMKESIEALIEYFGTSTSQDKKRRDLDEMEFTA